jgi:hypothetical protein
MTKKQKIKICEKVILHWWENLFLAYAGELVCDDIIEEKCAFCDCFDSCHECPIFLYTDHVCADGLWYDISWAINHVMLDKPIINSVEKFLKQLEYICDEWVDDDN